MSVTVWWATPAHVRASHRELLTAPEQERVAALMRQVDRDRFIVANALLRLAVAERLGHLPKIDRTCPDCQKPHGKPRVVGSDLEVSVSHSGERVAVALTELGGVGVDVEEMKPGKDLAGMVRYVFSPAELEPLQDPVACFYQAWTRKESVLKATGQGLRVPMSSITVMTDDSQHNLRDLDPGPGYAAAVTVLTPGAFTVTELDAATLLA